MLAYYHGRNLNVRRDSELSEQKKLLGDPTLGPTLEAAATIDR